MNESSEREEVDIAHRWCEEKGVGWVVQGELGKGGTAPVFEVASPHGLRALKIYKQRFSVGDKEKIEMRRIKKQLDLCGHTCRSLVQIYEGGSYKGRLFLLMERAPGRELAKQLGQVPRSKIRLIVDQITRAVQFLKTKGLCHRDIKAANIFVSEDFSRATLLDISVIRDIYDPIGVGTDHDGQLPVVATARYSPPEYLFRLEDSSPILWHALNVYQLGALLHDLIMREPLFEIEFRRSSDNRYRFAWTVATKTPIIEANDVDQDLIFKAKRALDKDWKRRASLKIEDFMVDSHVQEQHALALLGLGSSLDVPKRFDAYGDLLRRVREVARYLSSEVPRQLRKNKGITATHALNPGPDNTSQILTFEWRVLDGEPEPKNVVLELILRIKRENPVQFETTAILLTKVGRVNRRAELEMPPVVDSNDAKSELLTQVDLALRSLAVDLSRPSDV